ncbi:MAG: SMI1/KNR4 family protein [Polyangiaceae bacterium]|nr:SMI1/KNR4 family protein [Polyangiaceae bacterium]
MNTSWLQYFEDTSPGLSSHELDQLEKATGIELPQVLRELYSTVNDGRFRLQLFVDDAGTHYDLHELIPGLPLELGYGFAKIYRDIVQGRHLVPIDLIPFGLETGGNFYCVDRNDESVWYADMELNAEGVLPPPVRLAGTLDEFLRRCQSDDDI